jgi:hypothetical protein
MDNRILPAWLPQLTLITDSCPAGLPLLTFFTDRFLPLLGYPSSRWLQIPAPAGLPLHIYINIYIYITDSCHCWATPLPVSCSAPARWRRTVARSASTRCWVSPWTCSEPASFSYTTFDRFHLYQGVVIDALGGGGVYKPRICLGRLWVGSLGWGINYKTWLNECMQT